MVLVQPRLSIISISSKEGWCGKSHTLPYPGYVTAHACTLIQIINFIQIHKDQLAYRAEEYVGELYCMNLSCSDRGPPESGCLFFKVAGNTSTVVGKKLCLHSNKVDLCVNVFSDKFNDTVPGILHDQSDNDTNISSDHPTPTEINITTFVSVSATAESATKDPLFAIGGALFYTVIGVGGAIITLIFDFMIVCVLIGLSIQWKRKSHTLTIAATLLTHNDIHTQGMVCYINHTDILYVTILPFCGCAFDIVLL